MTNKTESPSGTRKHWKQRRTAKVDHC